MCPKGHLTWIHRVNAVSESVTPFTSQRWASQPNQVDPGAPDNWISSTVLSLVFCSLSHKSSLPSALFCSFPRQDLSMQPHRLYSPWNSPDQNTRVGSCSLLQGLNPGLPNCRGILCQLSHQGSPRKLEWVAYPFCSRPFQSRDRTRVSCIAGGFFTI